MDLSKDYSQDRFMRALNEKSAILQSCQNERGVKSCSACEEFIECQKRNEYVKAAYESMSKGQSGSFDFN